MIIKKIKSLKDTTLRTSIETIMLSKNQVTLARFKNKQEFEGIINSGVAIEVPSCEPEVKVIPVLYRDEVKMEKVVVIPESDLSNRLQELKLLKNNIENKQV
jgi:Leucine-rich repeat (LRR) protein